MTGDASDRAVATEPHRRTTAAQARARARTPQRTPDKPTTIQIRHYNDTTLHHPGRLPDQDPAPPAPDPNRRPCRLIR